MKMSFEILEKAMLVQRLYGTPYVSPPLIPNTKVSPKLICLDTGLVCHRLGVAPSSLKKGSLNDLFRGSIAEQVVGQEILAQNPLRRETPLFWYRNKPGATAEIDAILSVKGLAIPVEVKSGKGGTLKSIGQFMESTPHAYAVRIYSGSLKTEDLITPKGKTFRLLSLPFYLAFRLVGILENWIGD
jgi:predicted AAA+ superfamily ATPase